MASSLSASPRLRFGDYEADKLGRRLYRAGLPLKLRPQAFQVLVLMAEQAGQIVTREEIKRHLWGDSTFVDFERGINFSINQIRAVLHDNPDQPRYIETLPRVGYRFLVTVTSDEVDDLVVTLNDSANGRAGRATEQSPVERVEEPPRPLPWWRGHRVILICAGLEVPICSRIKEASEG